MFQRCIAKSLQFLSVHALLAFISFDSIRVGHLKTFLSEFFCRPVEFDWHHEEPVTAWLCDSHGQ